MITSFPLLLLPRRVAYVDDQGIYLDALRSSLTRSGAGASTAISRAFIDSPETALTTIRQEVNYWHAVEGLLAEARNAREERGEAKLYVERYFRDWRRFRLTSVLFIDYAMPGMNGVQLLEQLQSCPSRRVLLTGQADEQVAIRAFNAGQIQMFIPKNSPNLLQTVRDALDNLHESMCEHLGYLIRSTLCEWQLDLLHNRGVREALKLKLGELEWIEYIVVGQPFGMLGLSHGGPLQWLQIETHETLQGLAQGLSDTGWDASDVERVRQGTDISCDELLEQLEISAEWQGRLIPTDDICQVPHLVGALCDLPAKVVTAKQYGIENVSTPAELMRSLIRDVQMSYSAKGSDPDGYGDALAIFGQTAEMSRLHREIASATLSDFNVLHEDVRSALLSALSKSGGKR
ncbi:MAG: response regulator [Pseudomonadota bacterium]